MKKKTITIGALLLAMNCFSQTDTLAKSIFGKTKLDFNYYTSTLTEKTTTKEYKDFKFKLKKNEYLIIDLFDYLNKDTLYVKERKITVHYRTGEIVSVLTNSNEKTIVLNGAILKEVVVHKQKLK